ncbi:MAG: iron-only hydrogenase system regulator [Oscillospiraceae bacterium]|jgi:putative iron-only hydrogenase system regulator|nr:iron-only hydrogenase system regulator [Oscillospiraceae bacterium]
MENRVAIISIIVEDPASVNSLNALLHDSAKYIIGRMGIPYHEKGIYIICIAIDAPQDMISTLSGKIGRLSGISTKAVYSKVITTA